MEIHIEKEELAGCVREIIDDMFDHVLKRKKPGTIVIKTGGPDYTSFGTFNSGLSDEDKFHITLNNKLIHEYQDRECQFRLTLIHELMHAADQPLIQKYAFYKYIILTLRKKYSYKRLQWLLWTLHHFRVEGIADLCARLLWLRKKPQPKSRTDLRFCRRQALLDARFNTDADAEHFTQLMEKVMDAGEKLPKELSGVIRGSAYDYGCAIVLRALRNLQLISQTDEQQINTYIHTGGRQMLVQTGELSLFPEEKSELDEEVIGRVLNTCLSLNLPMFLEGLLLDREGKPLVPVTPLLTLCGDAQGYRRDDRIALFAKLLNSPQRTATEFNKAMKVLAGRPMPEKSMIYRMGEIHDYPGWPSYLGFNDKIDRLYAAYWEHKAAGRQDLAQVASQALHYFFRVKDMIGDFVPAFGFVDDLLVVDMALEILEATAFLPQEKQSAASLPPQGDATTAFQPTTRTK